MDSLEKMLEGVKHNLIIGTTGTRNGATPSQLRVASELVQDLISHHEVKTAIHGCCHGWDQEFHHLVRKSVEMVEGYPSSSFQYEFAKTHCDIIHPIEKPLVRDDTMAKRADFFIAIPGTMEELLRSGTWATIRYRRKYQKHLMIIFPNGDVAVEFPYP